MDPLYKSPEQSGHFSLQMPIPFVSIHDTEFVGKRAWNLQGPGFEPSLSQQNHQI